MHTIVKSKSNFLRMRKKYSYRDMLELLQDKPNVFQHDGAPPYILNKAKTLNRQLPERGSAEGGPLPGLRDLQI
jgi:hypothetical protein